MGLPSLEPSVEPDFPQDANESTRLLWNLFAQTWDLFTAFDPLSATIIGDYRLNHKLQDLSRESFDEMEQRLNDLNAQLQQIPRDGLSGIQVQNYDFLQNLLLLNLKKFHSFGCYEVPTTHLFGPHLLPPQLPTFHPLNTEKDAQDLIARLSEFPKQVDDMCIAFRAGIEVNKTLPRISVDTMIQQCEKQLGSPETNPLFSMVNEKLVPLGISSEQFLECIRDVVQPAYLTLKTFFEVEYLSSCRPNAGIWNWDNSERIYNDALNYFTSLPLTAQEVHELGVQQVERISGEMEKIKETVNFEGSLRDFLEHMKTNPEFAPASGQEILDGYNSILERMKSKMSEYFGRIPVADFEVRPIEPFREQNSPPAHYYPPPDDRSRPGIFYANLFKPETRVKYTMESIALHEAIPGHHHQIAVAQELSNLPRLRKQPNDFCTGFIEGWGLYTETLGVEMDFYSSIYQHFGRLTTEMMRAVRLVVDTGLHFYKWERQRAIDYFKSNSAMGDVDIEAEVDRYMVFPGQAVSYKVGELKIWEIRTFAETQLKEKFNLRDFHDVLLGSGALPLTSIDQVVRDWVTQVQVS